MSSSKGGASNNTTKEQTTKTPKNIKTATTTKKTTEDEPEELSDEGDKTDKSNVKGPKRRNIRSVLDEGKLDAATQLLREKEKERLQRFGLSQSIDMLRASVKERACERVKVMSAKKKSQEVWLNAYIFWSIFQPRIQ